MAWFTADVLDFFAELELDNDREWFALNKSRYEKSIKAPMEAFAEEIITRMKTIDPEISMTPKDAVFRIYRDVRFSKDKKPYKTNAGLNVSGKGRHGTVGVYFHIDSNNFGIACGYYMLEPAQIAAIRALIVNHPTEFAERLEDAPFKKYFGEIRGEKNKVLPQQFRSAAASQPYLFNKQFYYWAEYPGVDVVRDDLAEFVMEHVHASLPMSEFLGSAFC